MADFHQYNLEDLHQEVIERAQENGVTDEEGWKEMVEIILDEHINWGEVDIDDDVEGMRETLQEKWKKFEEGLNAGTISGG